MGQVKQIKNKDGWLRSIPANQLACRVRHEWPMDKLRPGKPVPRGISITTSLEGTKLVTETCPSCDKKRHSERGRFGMLLGVYSYTDPENWVKVPAEIGIYRSEARDAVTAMMWDELLGKRAAS